jgi:hypothetical protein
MQKHKFDTRTETKPSLTRQVVERQKDEHEAKGARLPQRDPFEPLISGIGDASSAGVHASMLNRATDRQPSRAGQSLLRLQRQYGNRYVQRVLALARKGAGKTEAAPDVEQAIQRTRGGGQALDSEVRSQMEPAFGADFSGVRVHTGAQSDTLNRELNARAFTTGQDIFFRQDAYNPGNSSGRELIAHELTHVVQQNGDKVQRKLTVGQPGDKYEQEADQVARAVMQQEQRPVQRESDEGLVRRQVEEEEEELQMKSEHSRAQQQVEKEEEEWPISQRKTERGLIRRQPREEEQEEEPIQTKTQGAEVQRQIDEGQPVQAKAITELSAPFVTRKIEKGELVHPKLIIMQRASSSAPAQLASRQQQPEAQKEPEKLKIERLDLHPYPSVIFNRRASITEKWNHLFASKTFGKTIRHKQCYLPSDLEAVKAAGKDPEKCRASQVVYSLAVSVVARTTNVINFPGDSWELGKPYMRKQIRNLIKYMESEEGQKKQEEQKKVKTQKKKVKTQKKIEYIRTLFESYVTETRDMTLPTKRIQCLLGKLVQPEVDDRYIPSYIINGLYNLAKHGAQQKTKKGIRPYPGTENVQHLAVGKGSTGTLSKKQLDSVFRASAREFVEQVNIQKSDQLTRGTFDDLYRLDRAIFLEGMGRLASVIVAAGGGSIAKFKKSVLYQVVAEIIIRCGSDRSIYSCFPKIYMRK